MELEQQIDISDTAIVLKEVFWRRGFDDASIEEIVKATGLNRYALYNAYGGKRDLFLAALDAYYLERKIVFLTHLNDPTSPPMEAIARVFEYAISEMTERNAGCLICNVATGLARRDPTISKRIESYLEEIRAAYCEALTRAAERGELHPNITPENGADLFITTMLGIGVQAVQKVPHNVIMSGHQNLIKLMLKQQSPSENDPPPSDAPST